MRAALLTVVLVGLFVHSVALAESATGQTVSQPQTAVGQPQTLTGDPIVLRGGPVQPPVAPDVAFKILNLDQEKLAAGFLLRSVNKAALGLVGVRIYRSNRLDGDPNTLEWVLNGVDPSRPTIYGMIAVAVVRGNRACIGAWQDPRPTDADLSGILDKDTPQDLIIMQNDGVDGWYYEYSPDLPAC